MGQCSVHTEK